MWTPQEELEYEALFAVAWALKGTDAYKPALATLIDWHQERNGRRAQIILAHRQASELETDRLVKLLQETDPAMIGKPVAA